MSQSIQLQVTQVGLEQSIAAAMKRVGSSSQINLGTSSKQINALSQPLGRITGQADEFSKSMAAANARVLAFGASAGIIAGVSSAMSGLLASTIKVEKSLVEISTVLNKTGSELDKFGQDIFNVAKNTGKSFDEVAKGALELARQGLSAEDTLTRLNDALILSRLSGLDATQSVEGLTAAFNSFKKSGITTAEILNKVVAASQKYAVSEKDIIEGLKRSASVANLAGVSFEELAAVITAVQEKTARGGAVIGNAFKTIFSRIQDKAVLSDLQDMRVGVTDLQGDVLPALKILENLAKKMEGFSQIEQADIAKKLGGVYQLDKLLAALSDLSDEASVTTGALNAMEKAGNSAYQKNAVLNQTLAALLNKVAVSAEQLGAKLGEIGVTDNLKNVLGFFNSLLEGIQKILGEESGLGNLVRGLVKGLGSFLAGPGLALFGGIILKLSKDLVQFGFASLKAFFGIGKAAKEVQNVEGAISQILSKNVNLQQQLFALEGNRAAQLKLITGALVEQEAILRKSANISSGLAAPLYNVGGRAKSSGLRIGNSAGGYMPAVAQESKSIQKGVGGARAGDKPVVMPNFNFGGGKKGTMVAHTGEYVVPNFNGSGGSAVFNRRMVQSMGLPSGAKKIGAAGGFVPNFAGRPKASGAPAGSGPSEFLKQFDLNGNETPEGVIAKINQSGNYSASIVGKSIKINDLEGNQVLKDININSALPSVLSTISKQKGESIYDARQQPNSAVMLIPQNSPYNSSGLNVAFTEKRKVGGKIYDRFIGGIAGIQENLSDTDEIKFSKISKIDQSLREGLSTAAFNILSGIQPGIQLEETSELLPKNIEGLLEKGGPGAFGALKGALFEGIINKVAEAKGRNFKDSGSLDIDFQAGGDKSRTILETIFGLEARRYDFADFKNSKKSKNSYIDQVVNYLPKDKSIVKAAGGYIPNFANPLTDAFGGLKFAASAANTFRKTLPKGSVKKAIKEKNFEPIFGPLLKFFQNPNALIKSNKDLENAKKAIKLTLNSDLIREAFAKRIAPLISSQNYDTSEVFLKAAGGISEFEKNVEGYAKYKLFGGTKNLSQYAPEGIKGLVEKGKYLKFTDPGYRHKIAEAPIGGLEFKHVTRRTDEKGGYYSENYLLGGYTGRVKEIRGGKYASYKDRWDVDLQKSEKEFLRERLNKSSLENNEYFTKFISDPEDPYFEPDELDKELGANTYGAVDLNSFILRELVSAIPKAKPAVFKGVVPMRSASGYIPSFADPLRKAIGREMAAGVSASQIYIDKNSSLKNAANPMGLMVANRRDEPAGGFQGINRARREGANPMMYGAAGGFVPNYAAAAPTGPDLSPFAGKSVKEASTKIQEDLKTALSNIVKKYDDQLQELEKSRKELRNKNKIEKDLVKVAQQLLDDAKQDLTDAQNTGASILDQVTLKDRAIEKQVQLDAITQQRDETKKQRASTIKSIRDLPSNRIKEENAAKTNATALTTAVSQNARRSVTNPLGRVRDPNTAPGGNRDMLGPIFAVQGAMTALTGATEGATNGFAKFANSFGAVASSVSTVVFAGQGLSQAFGGAEKGIGRVVGKLGVFGAAAMGVYTGFQELAKYLDSTNPEIQKTSEAMSRVSDAASKAAVNLNNINPATKARFETESEASLAMIGQLSEAGRTTSRSVSQGLMNFLVGTGSVSAYRKTDVTAGIGDDLEKNLLSTMSQARGVGMTKESINEILSKYAREGELNYAGETQITAQEAEKAINEIRVTVARIADKASPEGAYAALDKESQKKLQSVTQEQLDFVLKNTGKISEASSLAKEKGDGSALAFLMANPGAKELTEARDMLFNAGVQDSAVLDDYMRKIFDLAQTREKQEEEARKESEKSYRINTNRMQAEYAFEEKMKAYRQDASNLEIQKIEDVSKLEQDRTISDDYRAKKIAEINTELSKQISELKTIEEQQKNINTAVLDSLTGALGVNQEDLSGAASKLIDKLPAIDISNLSDFEDKLKKILDIQLPEGAENIFKPLAENLIKAQIANQNLTDAQKLQAQEAAKKLGIDLQIIDAATAQLSLEKRINNEIESRNSTASFNIEKRVLNNAYETLSINKEIEQIKRETSLNELQKSEQIYKLELKRRELESKGIGISLDKELLNIDQELLNKSISAFEQSKTLPKTILENSSVTADQLLEASKSDPSTRAAIQRAIDNADQSAKLAREANKAQQAGIAPVLESDIQIRAREGFRGGMERATNSLQEQIAVFESTIGEKIPQMFSDNMSSAINKMIEGGESFGDVLQGAAYEFVKGINQANIQNLSNKFSNFLFKSDGGAASGIESGASSIGSMLGFASGGKVSGGSGSKDDVPAMLMGGEYVVNKKAVSKYGPKFLEAINNGTLNGYAKGGKVQRGPQGNFYAPGSFGQGAISGKRNLLDFATQTGTSGKFDQMINESGYQSIALEPESSRLSVSGMRNSPQFEATQSAKQQAFDLYLQQYNAEREAKKQAKEQKKALIKQVGMLALSAALGPVINAAGAGFSAAFKGASGQGFMSQVGAGFKGIVSGGTVGNQQVGGLSNLFSSAGKAFSGDFAGAANQFKMSQIGNGNQLSDLYKSDPKFASYIDSMGGINTSGAPVATNIIPEAGRFSATRPNASVSSRAARSGSGMVQNYVPTDLPTSNLANTSTYLQYKQDAVEILKRNGLSESQAATFLYGLSTNDIYTMVDKARRESGVMQKAYERSPKPTTTRAIGRAIGGMIPSTSGIDTVPAMLSGGEFVMNRSAVQSIGAPNLQSMNSGGTSITSEETSKELNEKLLAKLDELIGASGSTGNITINVAPSGQTSQENSQDSSASRQQLARQIKDAVLQIINDEKRIGGTLRR